MQNGINTFRCKSRGKLMRAHVYLSNFAFSDLWIYPLLHLVEIVLIHFCMQASDLLHYAPFMLLCPWICPFYAFILWKCFLCFFLTEIWPMKPGWHKDMSLQLLKSSINIMLKHIFGWPTHNSKGLLVIVLIWSLQNFHKIKYFKYWVGSEF